MKRWICLLVVMLLMVTPVNAQVLKWVDFNVSYESLKYAMDVDIATFDKEKHISWIEILALAACRTGGKCPLSSVKKAVRDLCTDKSVEDILGNQMKTYNYYHTAYDAALGGLLGSFSIEIDGEEKPVYGLKAYSPIATAAP